MAADSFDADLHGADPAAGGRQTVALHVYAPAKHLPDSLELMARQLPGAQFSALDEETGFFDVSVEAPDREAAVGRVFDAVARAGIDDHIVIAEHPDIPGHWRRRDGSGGEPPPTA